MSSALQGEFARKLAVQLVIGLDRHKAHRRPCYRLGDRFRIEEIAFVGLHVRLHILRRYQPHLMAPFAQCRPRKCAPPQASMPINSTGRFAVKCKQLCPRELLAHHTFATQVIPTK